MGIFTKKINEQAALEFFAMAYTKILSKEEQVKHIDQLRQIQTTFPLLKDVKQQDFDENMRAVNIAWLEIAWTKYYTKKHVSLRDGLHFGVKMRSDVKSSVPSIDQYEALARTYTQAFGSSFTDGNGVMATQFVMQLLPHFDEVASRHPEETRQIILFFSSQFIGIFDACIAGFQTRRLIQ